ncbi:MAG: winged helix-turn-helix transcriptional regulator [Candidatus Aminicenantes bacterium]|nr:winged helix-turn-helix transcriptional regulator [Candidatus Aminicenantes bacterium]
MKKTVDILNALANQTRLHIFLILLQESFCVCELQEILGIEQSRLSHQLRILRYSGVVNTKQIERWTIYSVPEDIKKNKIVQAIKEEVKLKPSQIKKLSQAKKNRIWDKK